jgi:hypothetical protein
MIKPWCLNEKICFPLNYTKECYMFLLFILMYVLRTNVCHYGSQLQTTEMNVEILGRIFFEGQ